VPLTPEAVAVLRSWRKTQAAERLRAGAFWSEGWPDLVFTTEDGTPTRVDTFRHALRHAMTGAHPHRLRHSYATHLLEDGVPIHHVAELLGDTVATVEGTYSHVLRAKHEVVDVARGLLGGAT
jgi:integrase